MVFDQEEIMENKPLCKFVQFTKNIHVDLETIISNAPRVSEDDRDS